MGIRGGGSKDKTPPNQTAWHPGTAGSKCKGFALASCHTAFGTRGSLSSDTPPSPASSVLTMIAGYRDDPQGWDGDLGPPMCSMDLEEALWSSGSAEC